VLLTALLGVLIFPDRHERRRMRETRVAGDRLNTQLRTISAEQSQAQLKWLPPTTANGLRSSNGAS